MAIKIFFDMDGVCVDFVSGFLSKMLEEIEFNSSSSKSIQRLVNYGGDDIAPLTKDFIDRSTEKKDMKIPRTRFEKRANDAIMSVAARASAEVWASLPSLPNFHSMIDIAVNKVGSKNVYICTAPIGGLGGACEEGKRTWVSNNTNIYSENVFITHDKGSIIKMFPEDTCVLIDDRIKFINAWSAAGGITIHHKSPADMSRLKSTIMQINEL